jgi:Protein of unknown function (DUF2786)
MSVTTIDLNKIMGMVQNLLARADDPRMEFPEEAEAFRAKAEQLMREYRIAEEDLIAADQIEIQPEVHELWLGPQYDLTRGSAGGGQNLKGNSFYNEWYSLAYTAGAHAGVKVNYRWGRNPETNEKGIFAVLVGYPGDLRLAELIYTNARIVFGERLEPKPDPTLSDQVNAYRLRNAGITRDRVAKLLWGETSGARAALVGRYYKEECALRDETPVLDGRGINAALYRDQYAQAFVDEFSIRLRRARDAADSVGGALVLHGRPERVLERFYEVFPELRPQPKTEVAEQEQAVPAKKGRARRPYWDTAAGRRDYERRYSGVAVAGRSAGEAAAKEVPLDRPTPAQRLDPGAPRTPRAALEG